MQHNNTFLFCVLCCGTVTNEASKPTDDAVFDIITDEEVGQIKEDNSVHNESQTEEESLDHGITDL